MCECKKAPDVVINLDSLVGRIEVTINPACASTQPSEYHEKLVTDLKEQVSAAVLRSLEIALEKYRAIHVACNAEGKECY